MISKKEITKLVGGIGYDILDNIIGPVCGINSIVADLYLADIALYADEKESEKIIKKIYKKYKLKNDKIDGKNFYFIHTDWPIALIVLYILECGEY